VFAGSFDEVDGVSAALRRGPTSARVDAVEVYEAGYAQLAERLPGETFSVLRTI
jgi:hypothetical protein